MNRPSGGSAVACSTPRASRTTRRHAAAVGSAPDADPNSPVMTVAAAVVTAAARRATMAGAVTPPRHREDTSALVVVRLGPGADVHELDVPGGLRIELLGDLVHAHQILLLLEDDLCDLPLEL